MLGRKQSLVGEHNLVTADYLEEVDHHDGYNDIDVYNDIDGEHQMKVTNYRLALREERMRGSQGLVKLISILPNFINDGKKKLNLPK